MYVMFLVFFIMKFTQKEEIEMYKKTIPEIKKM